MNISQSLQNALDDVGRFLPKAVAFVAILIVGWIIAKLLRKGISKLLARVGLDRITERGGLRRFTGKYTASELTGTLVYALIMLFALQMAFNVFGANPVSNVINDLVGWLPQLFIAGVIMVVAFAIGDTVFNLVSGVMSSVSYGRPMARVAQVGIIAVAGIAALNQIGIATTVTEPILIAALAMVVGVVVVGVGGGLVMPMRNRWERMLGAAENEASNLKTQMSNRQQQQPEFGQSTYTSQQYTDSGMDVQQQQQQQHYTETGGQQQQQYYTPPPSGEQPPQTGA
ncbi:MAG TPA: hypothetical protein VE172_08635 [Stackebrandtia sp.]|jgi:small-conductance mechanosensitive channel|uniref:mechanosensitive ion channel family protein n=1 Tax=Stackebrandtia sp. TaxID=2023065 RepID=UPI002D640210|nr:hypothetical protein [Stackebrandtia sp.]HZE38864.1 hypothetical protein [Stackebrandtia sp.]